MNGFTTRDGVELRYTDTGGEGVPLVMLHGWGQTQAMFRHQVEGLGRRVVTVDQRGHGVSAKPHHGYRIARLARDAQELRSEEHTSELQSPVHLVCRLLLEKKKRH